MLPDDIGSVKEPTFCEPPFNPKPPVKRPVSYTHLDVYKRQAASLFDYLKEKNQIVYYGFIDIDDMKPGDLIFYGDYNLSLIHILGRSI